MSCNPNARYFIGDESQKPRYQAHVGYKTPAPNAYRLQAPNYSVRTTGLYNAARSSFYNSPAYSLMARGMPVYKPAFENAKDASQPVSPGAPLSTGPLDAARYNWAYERPQKRRQPQQQQIYAAPPTSLGDLQERLAEMAFAPKKRRRMQYETDYELYQPTWWVPERAAA